MKISMMTDRKGGGAYDCEVDTMPEYKAVDKLFYSFHSEFEAIVMDMITEKTDKRIMDTMFEDFDRLQEEYHEKLRQICREDGEDRG